MPEVRIRLQPSQCYHIYNRAVGNDNFFDSEIDYMYFIQGMREYIFPVTELIAYCLMPDRFDFVVRIKSQEVIEEFLRAKFGNSRLAQLLSGDDFIEEQLSRTYSNFFSAYAQHYNVINNRIGTLFKRAFLRDLIKNDQDMRALISSIHMLPVHERHVTSAGEWTYSSYNTIVNSRPSFIDCKAALTSFGGKENFLSYHLKHNHVPVRDPTP